MKRRHTRCRQGQGTKHRMVVPLEIGNRVKPLPLLRLIKQEQEAAVFQTKKGGRKYNKQTRTLNIEVVFGEPLPASAPHFPLFLRNHLAALQETPQGGLILSLSHPGSGHWAPAV